MDFYHYTVLPNQTLSSFNRYCWTQDVINHVLLKIYTLSLFLKHLNSTIQWNSNALKKNALFRLHRMNAFCYGKDCQGSFYFLKTYFKYVIYFFTSQKPYFRNWREFRGEASCSRKYHFIKIGILKGKKARLLVILYIIQIWGIRYYLAVWNITCACFIYFRILKQKIYYC